MNKLTIRFGKNYVSKTRRAWTKELLKDIIENSQDDGCYADNTIHDFYLHGFKGIENMTDIEFMMEVESSLEYKYHEQGNE